MVAKDLELAVEGARERRRSLASSIVRRIKHSQLSGAFGGLREATEQQREQRQVTARAWRHGEAPSKSRYLRHGCRMCMVQRSKRPTRQRTSFQPPHVVVGSDPQISMGVINKQCFVPPREMQSSAKLCAVGAPVHAVRASNLTNGNIDSTFDVPSAEAPFAAKLRSANTALQEEVESLTERLGVEVFS